MGKPTIPFHLDADPSRLAKKKPAPPSPTVTPADVRARFRSQAPSISETLTVEGPRNAAAAMGLSAGTVPDGTKMEIGLEKLRPYDRNPRRSTNEAYDSIKEGLRATGPAKLDLWVTQRPGDDWYMPYRGGNTRLEAIHSLFQEGDSRWARLTVTFFNWTSDADTLTQHLIENVNRGDMTFWDKAVAYMRDMRGEIERETGKEVSLRRLEDELAQRGIGVKKSLLAQFQFAVSRLSVAGQNLSGAQVAQLQPAINLLSKLATRLQVEDEEFQALLDKVSQDQLASMTEQEGNTDGLRADTLLSALEEALIHKLYATKDQMRRWRDTLARFPDISSEALQASGSPPTPPTSQQSVTPPSGESRESSVHEPREQAQATNPPSPPTSSTTSPSPRTVNAAANQPTEPSSDPDAETQVAMHAGRDCPQVVVTGPSDVQPDPLPVTGTAVTPTYPSKSPVEAVNELAAALGVADCLRIHPQCPAGYYMEIPEQPIDMAVDCRSQSNRVVGWQVMAMLSRQWEIQIAKLLPSDSIWRKMRLCEGGFDQESLSMALQDQMLVDISSIKLQTASDLGWGVNINLAWMVNMLADSGCIQSLFEMLLIHGQGYRHGNE